MYGNVMYGNVMYGLDQSGLILRNQKPKETKKTNKTMFPESEHA